MSPKRRPEAGQGTGPFGILLIDKPAGPTSHDVVGWVRWAMRERAVGHCGTLDPGATGLLVVCVGAATKLVEYLTGVDKRYRARFALGTSTTTADAQGEVLDRAPTLAPGLEAEARATLAELVGDHQLPPPAVSAIRVDGRRAHERVRAGETVELPPRPMGVRGLELGDSGWDADGQLWLDVDLDVTKGTYIRSLAEELGRRLGVPAHMRSLRRLACGELSLEDPLALTGLEARVLPARDARDEARPPRWRVELPGDGARTGVEAAPAASDEDRRARVRAALEAGSSLPWERLPFPVAVVGAADADADTQRALIARLGHGQRLAATSETLAQLGLPEAVSLAGIVDRAAGHMLIVRSDAGRLSPARTLRFTPASPSSPIHRA